MYRGYIKRGSEKRLEVGGLRWFKVRAGASGESCSWANPIWPNGDGLQALGDRDFSRCFEVLGCIYYPMDLVRWPPASFENTHNHTYSQ